MRSGRLGLLLLGLVLLSHCSGAAAAVAHASKAHKRAPSAGDSSQLRERPFMSFKAARAGDLPPPFSDDQPREPEEPQAPQEAEEEERDTRNDLEDTAAGRKRKTTALTLSILLGPLGADRFYLGHTKAAALKLLTLGGLGVWWIADIVMIATDNMQDRAGRDLVK